MTYDGSHPYTIGFARRFSENRIEFFTRYDEKQSYPFVLTPKPGKGFALTTLVVAYSRNNYTLWRV
mgnify:CR=1 FL=1